MRLIIIGSVAAGTSAACKARRNDINSEIVIYERDKDISYSVCGLPYFIGEDYITRENIVPRDPKWFKERFDIDIKIQCEVIEINPDKKEITVKNLLNNEIFKDNYDKLVISTGARSIKPPIDGIDNSNVFYLRNVENADKIKSFINTNKPKKAVIIGGGFIGLELLENFSLLNIDTTIIEMNNQLMAGIDNDVTIYLEEYLRKKNINILLGEKVEKNHK